MSQVCRFCYSPLRTPFVDLGTSPLSNAYLTQEALQREEIFYPLKAQICDKCFLVQLPQFEAPENIFSDYAYFSSYSDSWLQHASTYVDMMVERFAIDDSWKVIEIASNDGYLLQYFKAKNIPVLGVEPARNVALVAQNKGIPVVCMFFGQATAENLVKEGRRANLLIANNVLAHVPNLNDFIEGLKTLLAKEGVLTIEFPHLMRLIEGNQFDTIYHEHFSYFSLLTAQQIFEKHGLCIFDVEELPVHGGSLRLFIKHINDKTKKVEGRVAGLIKQEKQFGLDHLFSYKKFSENVVKLKCELLEFILQEKKRGKKIVGYGAPAKGNTLLNYCGITADFLPFTVDKNPYKQNHFLPGTRIPIFSPEKIKEEQPDYVFVLPWNLKNEIVQQLSYIKTWGGKFVIPIPHLEVI